MEDLMKKYEDKLPESTLKEAIDSLPKKISESKAKEIMDKIVEEYLNMGVEPGESVGLISAESIGEPGTQMSLDYGEKVIVKTENGIRIVRIGEFIDKAFEVYGGAKTGSESQVLPTDAEIFAPALSQDERVEWKKVTALSRHKSPGMLLKVTTRSGRRITATPYHSFVVRHSSKIMPVAGSELKKGERIPVVRELKAENLNAVAMDAYLPREKYVYSSEIRKATETGNSRLRRSFVSPLKYEQINNYAKGRSQLLLHEASIHPYQNHSRASIPEVLELSEDLGFFTGAYLAEGTHTRNYVAITNISREYTERCEKFARKLGINCRMMQGRGQFGKSESLIINSTVLADFLNITCSRKSAHKKVPSFAYCAGKRFIGSLLQAYFDGDGNISPTRKIIRASSNSEELINGIAILLGRLGIFSTKRADKKGQFWLTIPFRYSRKFKEEIGSVIPRKKAALESLASMEKTDKGLMPSSDVVWDEITGLEYVKPSSSHVYDFSVEGFETFTTFDGIITHNTLNTFHFAGVAEMNITTGLPRIIEILDGRKSITTPMMEIYLRKPYSQGKDIKKVALFIKETKLGEIADEFTLNLADSRIEVRINEEKAKELSLTEAKLIKALKLANKNLNIDARKDTYIFKAKKSDDNPNEIYKLKEKIKESYIRGVRGITQVLPVKKDGEFMIITAGSNLKKVLGIPFVDETRTTTNDIFEIEQTLGIEAARQALINEVYKVIENQGLNVDIRHLMLVADTMCYIGKMRGITRYGVVKDKSSVLARASFETPIKHIISASITGEVDKLNSVVENVMLNQPVPVGTGMTKLIVKNKAK